MRFPIIKNLLLLLVFLSFAVACSDSAQYDIDDANISAPAYTLTGMYTLVQFEFDVELGSDCGSICDASTGYTFEEDLTLELIDAPTGAELEYINHPRTLAASLYSIQNNGFYFKTNIPGTYTFRLILSGELRLNSNDGNGDVDSDSEEVLVTIEVLENDQEYLEPDRVRSQVFYYSSFHSVWSASEGAYETEAYILSADDDSVVTFDVNLENIADVEVNVVSFYVEGQTYRFPFVLPADNSYFGGILFADNNANGIDEIVFSAPGILPYYEATFELSQ